MFSFGFNVLLQFNVLLTDPSLWRKLDCMEELTALPQFAGRRAAAYWFSDGLPEIAFGLALAAVGSTGMATVYSPYWWTRAIFAVAFILFLALFLWDRRILGALKARLTYPRTGYVQPPKNGYPQGEYEYILSLQIDTIPNAKSSNVTSFRMMTLDLFLISTMMPYFDYRWTLVIVMFAIACFVYLARRWSEYPYSPWSVLPLAVSGIPLFFLHLSIRAQEFVPMLIGGLWLFCRGVWTMIQYLQANRHPQITESTAA